MKRNIFRLFGYEARHLAHKSRPLPCPISFYQAYHSSALMMSNTWISHFSTCKDPGARHGVTIDLKPFAQHGYSIELCEDVAATLNRAGVENILWGAHLLETYTVPIILQELCFAVPDSQLQIGVTTLQKSGLDVCQDKTCPKFIKAETEWEESFTNPPVHFHLEKNTSQQYKYCDTLELYTTEDVLWELPVGKGVDFTDGPSNNIIFANDPTLRAGTPLGGWGRFPSSKTPVRIPTWHRYVEALILNAMTSKQLTCSFSFEGWTGELLYALEKGDRDKLGHPAFTQMFNSWFRRSATSKEATIAAQEILSRRIHRIRPRPSLKI